MSDRELELEHSNDIPCNYYLVQFVHKGRKKKVEDIDIVPSKWFTYDNKRKRCVCQFLQKPYSGEDILMLHSLVKNLINAPADWPTFPVVIKGRAQTYDEAMKKLTKLRTEPHVLTLESEENCSEAQKKIEDSVRQRDLVKAAEKMKQELAGFNLDNNKNSEASDDDVTNPRKKLKANLSNDANSLAYSRDKISNDAKPQDSKSRNMSYDACSDSNSNKESDDEEDEDMSSRKNKSKRISNNNARNKHVKTRRLSETLSASNSTNSLIDTSVPSTYNKSAAFDDSTKTVNKESDINLNASNKENSLIDALVPSTSKKSADLYSSTKTVNEQGGINLLPHKSVEIATVINSANSKKQDNANMIVDVQDIPIINVSNGFENTVLALLSQIEEGINDLRISVKSLERRMDAQEKYLVDKKVVSIHKHAEINFYEKYEMRLPLDDLMNFEEFEKALVSNQLLKSDVLLQLSKCIDKQFNIPKSIVNMLKTFITKDVAQQFTSVRRSREPDKTKEKFVDTHLWNCIKIVITGERNKNSITTEMKDLITGLSEVLCNAKRWK